MVDKVHYSHSQGVEEKYPLDSKKFVNTCRNCMHIFRIISKELTDFCSKDCETTFNLGILIPSDHQQQQLNYSKRTVETTKQMIYEFQRQIDTSQSSPTEMKPIIKPSSDILSRDDLMIMKKYFQPKIRKNKSAQDIQAQNQSIWHTATPWHYNPPKPIRPQLHAFF